ncbi:MAG TPA: hypothetical protein PK137_03835 [Anaerolineaceae bacterium]|jgi:hypothetical protein|nr:hypothetical protein [Anaerolineales bacterium]HOG58811.1 hypothetical protein [Anaerolineaceae bacterium]HOR83331.1 hypothetical protein [Anaerolineaceae bacterium]HPL42965.1 hypothetical protein [Anaerolineaceae bacterium]
MNDIFPSILARTYDAFYVLSVEEFDDIYDNDSLTIYGIGAGKYCGTNAFGGQICQPVVVAGYILK